MTREELVAKIRTLAKDVYRGRLKADVAAAEYDELTKFPELKKVIVDLLTADFDYFLASIDWVAPRPTTFRINLKNGQDFYLIYTPKTFIAQIEGKKYYLLNLNEEESACESIARILRYGGKTEEPVEGGTSPTPPIEPAPEETPVEPEV